VTVLYNNFSTGPDGADIRVNNSGGSGDNAFDSYQNPPGEPETILKFKDASGLGRPTAEFVARLSSGVATTGNPHVVWYTSMGAQSQFWVRCYYYFTVRPDNFLSPLIFQSVDLGTDAYRCDIGILRDGGEWKLFTENAAGTVYVATTNDIPEDVWFRVEARFQTSTTTGNGEVRLYLQPDANLGDYTESISFSGWNLGGATSDYYAFGYTERDSNLETMYMSGLALSNEGWIGPAPFRPGKGVPGILTNPVAVHTSAW
jgi:hypothetical protein